MGVPSRYCQSLTENLWLTAQQVMPSVLPTVQVRTNYILLLDASGSMWSTIRQAIDDIKEKIRGIPRGCTFTFGYFSSEGLFDFPLKGFKLADDDDYDRLEGLLEKYKRTLSLTCFSEILESLEQVVADLGFYSDQFSLWLFTDGHPVVSNTQREIERIEAALKRVAGKLAEARFIGYGDYYNKPLMADMAMWAGGSLMHCSALKQSAESLQEMFGRQATPRVEVPIDHGHVLAAFTLHTGELVGYDVSGQSIQVSPDANAFWVYTIAEQKPIGWQEMAAPGGALYAVAAILSRKQRKNDALEVLSGIGDVGFVRRLSNAYTLDELGSVENEIVYAALNPASPIAFAEGKQVGCLPKRDAFCVVELMDLLMNDPDARFHHQHPDFKYKRTTRKSVQKPGFPEFTAYPDQPLPFNGLTWNQEKINLSALFRISGAVDLGEEADSIGLPQTFHTWVFRNYSIINNGALVVSKLPISCGETTWNKLVAEGLIEDGWADGKIAVLNLKAIPVVNRVIAEAAAQPKAASKLAASVIEEAKAGAKLKVFRYLLEQIQPEESGLSDQYTPEQQEFLLSKGIKKNGFSPDKEQEEATDQYPVRTFKVSVAGWSSLPKVSEVETKLGSNKIKPGSPAEAMAQAIEAYNVATANFINPATATEKAIGWLKGSIEDILAYQRAIRKEIQATKFSALVGGEWFDELPDRDGEIKVGDHTVKFSLGEAIVKI